MYNFASVCGLLSLPVQLSANRLMHDSIGVRIITLYVLIIELSFTAGH